MKGDNEVGKRDILDNIEVSLKEIEEYKEGKREFRTLKESKKLWDKWIKKSEDKSK